MKLSLMERQRLKDLAQTRMSVIGTQILQSPLGSIRMTPSRHCQKLELDPSRTAPPFPHGAAAHILKSHMSADLPTLTERQIKSLVGSRSFDLGLDYVADRALSHCRRAGRLLTACVQGTANKPYNVTVNFDADGFKSATCTCPVGSDSCKHVAAVLIAFARTPDLFVPTEVLDQRLEKLDKPRLIALLKQIFQRHPTLEKLLDTIPDKKKPLAAEAFQAQADDIFDNAPDEWGYTTQLAADLHALLQTGDDYAAANHHANAAAVYRGLIQSILEHEYALNDDEPGDLSAIVIDCSTGLGKCLAVTPKPADRQPILQALFTVYNYDAEQGGTGISDDAATILFDQTTPEDKRAITPWIRTALRGAQGWARATLTGLLEAFEK